MNSHLTEVLIVEERAAFIRGDNLSELAAQCCRFVCSVTSKHQEPRVGMSACELCLLSLQTPTRAWVPPWAQK